MQEQKHILIAEDDTFLSNMMSVSLVSHGVRVSVAPTGREAIDILRSDPPDLLLLDLHMPHVDGYAVLQERQAREMPLPVIICSNSSDKKNRDRCTAFGVQEYIAKCDMDREQLWPVVEKYFR